MKRLLKHLIILMIFSLLTIGSEQTTIAMSAAVDKARNIETTSQTPETADSYSQTVVPLTTLECARCHESTFNTIRDNGGQHRQECRVCHETFHNYRPGTDWQQAVPKCETCHGEIHGSNFKSCLDCHGNPHAPIAGLVNMTSLGKNCGNCHTPQAEEIQQYPSAHAELQCSDCHHSRHGKIPNCSECHADSHVKFADNNGCSGCHPAHKPTDIHYADETPSAACSGCHEEVSKRITITTKKHTNLQCAYCHSETHGYIPDCRKCHGLPHSKAMLDKFDGCLVCHGDPHALMFPGE